MARIFGFLGRSATGRANPLLGALGDRLQRGAGWSVATEDLGPVALGWTGPGPPALTRRGRTIAVLDGQIHNRRELGDAPTDVELLLDLYDRHGFAGALARANSELACAVYDEHRDVLWLGRDRLGVKPLYHARSPEIFAFASQPGSLLALPGVRADVRPHFVALFASSHYRTFDNRPDESPYEDVGQLRAGHLLEVKAGSERLSEYWRLEDAPDFAGDERDLAARYRDLLIDSVALRLQSADRPAFTLSGGMDSSSVVASAVEVSGDRQSAFSSTYSDATFDETADIRPMLDEKVEHWRPVPVDDPDVMGIVRDMVEIHEEPVATATWLSHFLLCQEVGKAGFGALFGGLGGDELNAGEYEYFFFYFADLVQAGRRADFEREVAQWVAHHDHPIHRKSLAVAEAQLVHQVDLSTPGRCLPNRERLMRYAPALDREFFDLGSFEPVMDQPFTSYLKNRTHQDIFRETAPCCLRAEDRHTTAFDLQRFDPFFDHRLVEYMFRIPGDLKIRDGVTKRLLREAMRGVLPEETRSRVKKTGWNAPAHLWFCGAGAEPLADLVRSSRFRERGIYDLDEVDRLFAEHQRIVAGNEVRENHMMFFWQLVNLELWLQWLEAQGQADPGLVGA